MPSINHVSLDAEFMWWYCKVRFVKTCKGSGYITPVGKIAIMGHWQLGYDSGYGPYSQLLSSKLIDGGGEVVDAKGKIVKVD
jgi:hypothetical protein